MAFLRIDPSGAGPVFQQIVDHVKRAIATGQLRTEDRLPSVRELAKELVINPNTIARAYQVLDAEGITYSRRGAGTFVAAHRRVVGGEERRRRFREAIEAALADAFHTGVSEEEARRAFDAALTRFRFQEER
ncbi:MAG: GntR family transcriptional regulator [Planctomycetaceae bacterium]